MPGSDALRFPHKLILVGVLALAAWLRLTGAGAGLPFRVGVDEPVLMEKSLNIVRSGDFHPHFWDYGGLTIYLHSAVASVRFLYGATNREWRSLGDENVWPGAFYHWSRLVTGVLGTLTVFLVFRSAVRWGPLVGLVAALAMAIQPQHVRESHFALTDTPLTFFVALTLLLSQRAAEGGRFREFFIAGVAAGFATATKYNGALAVLMPLAVVLMSARAETRVMSAIAVLGGAFAGFAAAAPYSLIDLPGFLNGFAALLQYYNAPRPFGEMASTYYKFALIWFGYPALLPRWVGYPAMLMFLLGCVLLLREAVANRLRGPAVAIVLFAAGYFWFISNQSLQFGRYLMPIVPMISIGLAIGLVAVHGWIAARAPARSRLIFVLLLMVLIPPAMTAASFGRDQRQVSTEERAGRWLTAHVKPNERIVFEATFQLPPKYQSERVVRLITHPLAHYRTDGTAYLVASAGEYDKYFNDPARFSQQINEYNEIFKGTELVETFAPTAEFPAGPVIRILRVVR